MTDFYRPVITLPGSGVEMYLNPRTIDHADLRPYLIKKLEEAPDSFWKDDGKECTQHIRGGNILQVMRCYDCLKEYTCRILAIDDLPGELLCKFKTDNKYVNASVWEFINHEDIVLTDNQFYKLCFNRSALPYIETHVDRINDRCLRALFHNPSAIDFIISQNYNGKMMVEYGARHSHFYNYFDHFYCRRILRGGVDDSLIPELYRNKSASEMVETLFDATWKYDKNIVNEMGKYDHFAGFILRKGTRYFRKAIQEYLNNNQTAINVLLNNPEYIDWNIFAENDYAIDVLTERVKTMLENGDIDTGFRYAFNTNPAAVKFLLSHPEFIDPWPGSKSCFVRCVEPQRIL